MMKDYCKWQMDEMREVCSIDNNTSVENIQNIFTDLMNSNEI